MSNAYILGTAAITTAAAVTGIILAPIAAPAVLGIVGFGAAGPIAGTPMLDPIYDLCPDKKTGGIAAGIQGPAIVAGSGFAVAQSVAMGGALPAVGYVVAGAITAIGGFFSGI